MKMRTIDKGLVREIILIGLIVFFILFFLLLLNYRPVS